MFKVELPKPATDKPRAERMAALLKENERDFRETFFARPRPRSWKKKKSWHVKS